MIYVAVILGTGLVGFALTLTIGLFIAEISGVLINLDGLSELFRDKLGW